MPYRIREATLADADVLVRHRIAMFVDMGIAFEPETVAVPFRAWLQTYMPSGAYRAWVVEHDGDAIVAGGGATIIPWPPGPRNPGDRLAFVYNVYVEPAHRGRGLAKRVMDAIHAFCRANGVTSVALNASRDGRPLYESLGYQVTPSPMMFFAVQSEQ